VFRNFPEIDTPAFVVKAVNRHDKSFNVGIVMDDDKPPLFTMLAGPAMQPWYLSSDAALLNTAKNNRIRVEREYLAPNGHLLKEVKVEAKKLIQGSQNHFGEPDIIIDEKDLEKAKKKTFLQLFQENIKGFDESAMTIFTHDATPNKIEYWYLVHGEPVIVSVDGENLNTAYSPFTFQDFKNYLTSHTAEDIRGIEIINRFEFVLVEITTRSGRGPTLMVNTPGMYLYKPLALSWAEQFYKPRYTVNDTTKHLPDTRSTIDWEPNVITDKNGNATVSFYAADRPGTYTIIMEGTDGNGNLGYKMEKIIVSKHKTGAK
jgi:hypothetical protein